MGAALSVVLGMMGPVQMGQNGGESPRPPVYHAMQSDTGVGVTWGEHAG